MHSNQLKMTRYIFFLTILCGLFLSTDVHAENRSTIDQFIGYYLLETDPAVDEVANPFATSLSFNEEGKLTRYSGLLLSTTGTSEYFDYTNYEITGNTITCYYPGSYTFYGPTDRGPGVHRFTATKKGNLKEDGSAWFRYVSEYADPQPYTLMEAGLTDFPESTYSNKAGFLGNKNLKRKSIRVITFLDTLDNEPENSWDVSYDRDGTVKAWTDKSEGFIHVYIAADGKISAPENLRNLFRLCTNLEKIDFSGVFLTENADFMGYMFAGCKNLKYINGLENFDTSGVYSFSNMFANDKSLTKLDLSSFDTARAHEMNRFFFNCSGLEELNTDRFTIQDYCDISDIYTGTRWEGGSPGETGGSSEINPEILEQSKKELLNQLTQYNSMVKEPITFCETDLDQDGTDEIIVRYFNDAQFEDRGYGHDIYWYSAEKEQYLFSEDNRFFTPAWAFPYYWKEKGYLVLDETFAETELESFTFHEGTLTSEGTTSESLSYLPQLVFTEIPAEPDASWKEAQQKKMRSEIYSIFARNTKESIWYALSDRQYAVADLNNDGKMEMIERAWSRTDSTTTLAVYTYNESETRVIRLEVLNALYDDVFYSPKYNALVTYFHSNTEHCTYYTVTDSGISERSELNGIYDKSDLQSLPFASPDDTSAEASFKAAETSLTENYDPNTVIIAENTGGSSGVNPDNAGQTDGVIPYEYDGLSFEDKIQQIRDWYYSTEDSLSSMEVSYDETGLEASYYQNGSLKKIAADPGTYSENDYPCASVYASRFYYHDGAFYFAFIFQGTEEYRYYFTNTPNGTKCIRYIDPYKNTCDYPDGIDLSAIDSPTSRLCMRGLEGAQ